MGSRAPARRDETIPALRDRLPAVRRPVSQSSEGPPPIRPGAPPTHGAAPAALLLGCQHQLHDLAKLPAPFHPHLQPHGRGAIQRANHPR